MTPNDWKKLAKWSALVYAPIALLICGIFFLVEWQAKKVDEVRSASLSDSVVRADDNYPPE